VTNRFTLLTLLKLALLVGYVETVTNSSQSRKHRGYKTERVVAEYLSSVWEFACVGRGKGKDIQNVPFDVEVKARNGFQPKAVLSQIKARTTLSGEVGFAVLRLNGQGEDAREYAAVIRLEDLLTLLELKYGHIKTEPKEEDISRCLGCGNWIVSHCPLCDAPHSDK